MNRVVLNRLVCFSLILALFIAFSACESRKIAVVKTQTLTIDSLDQIVDLDDSLVKPILYTHISGLEKISAAEGKSKFIAALLPAILVTKHRIETTRVKILELEQREHWNKKDSTFFFEALQSYKAKNMQDLLQRMIPLPNSIILAQAAVETGWGTSRFFVEANNVFGIWSMNANDMRMAAVKTRNNKTIYVRAYHDISGSVAHYFQLISRSPAYMRLRHAGKETSDPFLLLPHLNHYSEMKSVYTGLLKDVIEQNDLMRYDHYQIDPKYVTEEVW